MLRNEYKREMEHLGPSQEELERLYAMIEGGSTVKRTKRLGRRAAAVLMAAALCMALGITALAVSPTLQEILSQSLGGFEPYSQTVEGVSAVDQGIQVSVVRAIADESGGTAYLEIKDLTGDRLTEDTDMSILAYPIAYDPETRTLLSKIKWLGNDEILGEDGNLSFTIKEIWGGETIEDIALPTELLEADNVLQTMIVEDQSYGKNDDRMVLVPEQTPMDLGVEWFTLSSMGFDEKGRLHVQVKLADGYDVDPLKCFPNWLPIVGFLREKKEIGEISSYTVQGSIYRLKEGQYIDYRLEPTLYKNTISPESEYMPKEWYQGLELALVGWIGTRERVEGEWTLTVPIEILPERTVTVGQVVNVKLVETATFSIKGFTLRTTDTTQTRGSLSPLTAAVYLADGSHVTIERGYDAHWYKENEPYYLTTWEYPEPIDPAEVTAISLGYWYIPLDGETAGPGHWLSELPE